MSLIPHNIERRHPSYGSGHRPTAPYVGWSKSGARYYLTRTRTGWSAVADIEAPHPALRGRTLIEISRQLEEL